jgi:tetratricopeptide (TPR) repeat protein
VQPEPGSEAVALHAAALAAADDGRFADVVGPCRRAIELLTAEGEAGQPDLVNVLTLLATAEDELGWHAQAEQDHRRALAVLATLPVAGGDVPRLLVQALLGLAGSLRWQGRYSAAEELYRQALATAEAAPECGPLDLTQIWNECGILFKFAGRLDEAQQCYDRTLAGLSEVYGPDDPRLAAVHHNLAGLAHSQRRPAEAEAHARRSLQLHLAALPADHPKVVADEAHLGAILEAAGRLTAAEPLLRRAVAYFIERYGPTHYEVAVNLHNLAAVRAGQGALAEAETLYLQALEAKRAALGPGHPEVGLTLSNLAALAAELGQLDRARTLAEEGRDILAAAVTADHPALVVAEANVAALAAGSGRG